MSKKKGILKYTLGEVESIANKQFPPPWAVIEALARLSSYVKSYEEKTQPVKMVEV
jgi:hypothetical protein